MELGLFTCGYQYTNIESAFIDAAAFGYDFIELWGGRPHAWAPDMDAGRVAQLQELSARYAAPIRVYTPEHNGYPYNYMPVSYTHLASSTYSGICCRMATEERMV